MSSTAQLELSEDGKTFTGKTIGPIIDGERKGELLDVLTQAEALVHEQVSTIPNQLPLTTDTSN